MDNLIQYGNPLKFPMNHTILNLSSKYCTHCKMNNYLLILDFYNQRTLIFHKVARLILRDLRRRLARLLSLQKNKKLKHTKTPNCIQQ